MIATELLLATLFSSLVGSLHCVGMCTPFAILSMGPAGSRQSKSAVRLASYHLGRLVTYLALGTAIAILSSIGSFVIGNVFFKMIGWLVGFMMVSLGVTRLFAVYGQRVPVRHSRWLQQWAGVVVKLRRSYAGGPYWLGAFLWGLTSTLLPCGWLYIFVMAAATAPGFGMSLAMMVAFWLGTLPLLSTVAWGWVWVPTRWQTFMQPFAAGCIISFGTFILVKRGVMNLEPTLVRTSNSNIDSACRGNNAVYP